MATPNLTAERIHQVRLQNDAKFWRQPNVHAVGEGYLKDATGGWRSLIGIIVYVRARVDQSALPEADRIPELLDGVPTEIRQENLTTINLMGTHNDEHRPLTSGITIQSVQPVGDTLEAMGAGTLTGVAWRNGKRVLVTVTHVMAGCGDQLNPTLTRDMYQELVAESVLTSSCEDYKRLYSPTESKKIGDILAWTARYSAESSTDIHEGDFAICDIDSTVTTDFLLHEDPHGSKVVIPGVVDPTIYPQDPGNPMILTMVGARSGIHTLTVRAINEQRILGDVRYKGLTVFEPTDNTGIKKGDSGAACLVKVPGTGNRYKMSCILTASSGDERRGFGFPASTAERLLGIKFGNHPPVANAGDVQHVSPGDLVELNGSATDEDSGDTFIYQWSQVSGRSPVSLTNPNTANPTFTAPQTAPNWESFPFTFRLKVTDSDGGYDTADVVINVAPTELLPGPVPTPPPQNTPTPTPTPTPTWEYTGRTDGCGPSFRRERRRGSVTEWVNDPQPDPWGDYEKTGTTRGCGPDQEAEELSTSECGRTRTRWVDDPQPDPWGGWVDTGNIEHFAPGVFYKEQQRTSDCGNVETTWVPV